jgi:hypothetical protein
MSRCEHWLIVNAFRFKKYKAKVSENAKLSDVTFVQFFIDNLAM